MSSIRAGLTMHTEGAASSGKAYVSTSAFNNAFYTYTAYTDTSLVGRGQFRLTATSTALCPAGRILALSGRKLTPGVNPMDYFVTSAGATLANTTANGGPGVKFMVGVVDMVTGLNGFIDPTNRLFANYDSNRPITDYIADANTLALGFTVNTAAIASGQGANLNTVATTTEPIVQATSLTTAVNVGAAVAGKIQMFSVIPTTPTSFVVNTTAVTANSVILLTPSYSSIDPLEVTSIPGTAGVFNVTGTGGLVTGQPIVITGTNTGTGSITGYTSGTVYYITTIVANTSFTLSATSGGSAITTVAGTAAGLVYSRSTSSFSLPVTTNAGTAGVFGIVNTGGLAVGQAVVITGTFTTGSIVGYTSGTTYYIITIVTNTSFTLSATPGGSAVTTTASSGVPGVTFTIPSVNAGVVPIAAVGPVISGSSFTVTVSTGTATTYSPIINFLIIN